MGHLLVITMRKAKIEKPEENEEEIEKTEKEPEEKEKERKEKPLPKKRGTRMMSCDTQRAGGPPMGWKPRRKVKFDLLDIDN